MKSELVLERIRLAMQEANLPPGDKPRLLVTVSGGADSVCMLHALMRLGYDCVVAHCNFHLRGEESMRDERFVRELCQKLGITLYVRDFDVPAYQREHRSTSVEMACRTLRYEWFSELRQKQHCKAITVAHHADDNVETFFINLLRGTGIDGLCGMSKRNRTPYGLVLRPLLDVTREQVLDFLQEIGQDYVTDSTNLESNYVRNRLRNIVLPQLDEQFPGARERISDTMSHLADEREFQDFLLNQFFTQEAEDYDPDEGTYRYDLSVLRKAPHPGFALYKLIEFMGFNRVQCDQVFSSSAGAQFFSGEWTLTVKSKILELRRTISIDDREYTLNLSDTDNLPINLVVSIDNPPFTATVVDGKHKVAFNNDLLQCQRLVLRHWRRGDRFRPYGLRGSKLVSDLLTEAKFSSDEKKAVWLLEADGVIVWVLGLRSAQAYVVAPGSTQYVLLQF